MTADDIAALFKRSDGAFLFARWGRPLAPVVFGVDDATLRVVKGACEAVTELARHEIAETDPELGANLMIFFFSDWEELLEVPHLDRLVPDFAPLVARLIEEEANQYRIFRFDEAGAIKAAFVFVRMDGELQKVAAETLALSQLVQVILLWSDTAFRDRSALAVAGDQTILRPDIAALIRAAYDPVLPGVAKDASHAMRLAARIGRVQ